MNDSLCSQTQQSLTSQSIVSNYKISTTGISKIELVFIKNTIPEFIEIVELTPCTDYLMTPRMKYNNKILAALNWKIPIVSVEWLYNTDNSINNYLLKPFQDMTYTFSDRLKDKNEDLRIKNFFYLQGGIYQPKITDCTNFIIQPGDIPVINELKPKHQIPVIPQNMVYLNRFHLFLQQETVEILKEKIERKFFIDSTFSKSLYNLIKKHVISLKAKRVSDIEDADYILTSNFSDFDKTKYNCLNYSYIFDSSEKGGFLYTGKYKIYSLKFGEVFKNFIFGIDNFGIDVSKKEEIKNKIIALSGTVLLYKLECANKKNKLFNQRNITHIISKNERGFKSGIKFVDESWLNSALLELKVQRDKISFTSISEPIECDRISYVKPRPKFFMFSGILNKQKCIDKLKSLNYDFSDSNTFDERCTHLIVDNPVTSEKLTCAVINGLILIKSDWAESEGSSLNEYKWRHSSKNDKLMNAIIGAIKYWREQRSFFDKKPFDGWIVKIEDVEVRQKFSKILEFGGAKLQETEVFTHEFIAKDQLLKETSNSKKKNINFIFHSLFRML
ncbi:DNA topoisomerase 2-binding protein 1 [Cucumispora dikerogammari]|nr:DNA topoisomerase 2-binding protein 1 [Cucumispora dikerogammari]